MVQTSNQFELTVEKGQLILDSNINVLNAQVSTNEAATLVPAQAVKLENAAGEQIPVIKVAAITDVIFGFIPYNVRTDEYVALDQIKIAGNGEIMEMEAGAAIARGAELELVLTGNKVVTQATGTVVGVAIGKAAASGDIIKVRITV